MARRIAAALSMIAFAICLLIGAFQADNSFSTTVQRALVAMVVTLIVGLVVGAMAQKMLDENLKHTEEKSQIQSSKTEGSDR
jgi:putative Mn2+ efflux pump MntP